MKCPECKSDHINKNGHRGQKQNYICVNCGRQFNHSYETKGYSDNVKRSCLKMYVNGMGFRGIESNKWENCCLIPIIQKRFQKWETFVGKKKNKIWIWTAVDHFRDGILGWVIRGLARRVPSAT
jgi:insertion element IS1 protein InsB